MSAVRILVTGSRDWSDQHAIEQALQDWISDYWHEHGPTIFVVIEGACPTGADDIAHKWAERTQSVVSERHPADWKNKGRGAGPERNKYMVELSADVCFAFIGDCTSPRCKKPRPHPSHGASGCADLAEKAGIETKRILAS